MPDHSSLVTGHGDEVQAVFEILTSLSHSEIAHILGDVYSIYGWKPTLTTDDDDTPGHLVVNQILPEPKSLVIHYYGEDVLTDQELEDRLEKLDHHQLVVIVESAPTDQAVGFARHAPVSILGVGDIAEEIVASSMLNVLRANIPDTDPLLEKYDGLFSQLPEQTETSEEPVDDTSADGGADESTDDATDEFVEEDATDVETPSEGTVTADSEDLPEKAVYQQSADHPTLSDQSAGAQNQFFGVSYLGHECVEIEDSTVLFLAIEVFAKEYDIKLRPEHLTAHSAEQFSYEAARPRNIPLYNAVASELSAPWVTDRTTISAGSKVNYLAAFTVPASTELQKVRYSSSLKNLLTMSNSQIDDNIKVSRHFETALEVTISPGTCDLFGTLPSLVKDTIANILDEQDTDDRTTETILTPEDTGLEDEDIAVRIISWEFYSHSTNEVRSRRVKDGMFIAAEITSKRPDEFVFSARRFSVDDYEGYNYAPRK